MKLHGFPLTQETCLIVLLCFTFGLAQACSGLSQQNRPDWIDGESKKFPTEQFLAGHGEAQTRPLATERAYEAVARIFQSQVISQAKDRESYRILERHGSVREERQLTLDHSTQVSTNKILEQVQVLDTWFNPKNRLHHALAGLNRKQAETTLLERLKELDQRIKDEHIISQQTMDKRATIRHMKRAINTLTLRETINSDLRVVRTSGQGHPAQFRLGELTGQLESYMAKNLVITVQMTGIPAAESRQSVIEGLLQEGLPVLQQSIPTETPSGSSPDEQLLHLGMKGFVTTWEANVGDPEFQFVGWCTDIVMIDHTNNQMVGAVSRRGREGQLTNQAARQKSIRVMQNVLTRDVAKTLAGYIYGEPEPPKKTTPPAACPRNAHSS